MLLLDDAFAVAQDQLAAWSARTRSLAAADLARPAAGLAGWDVEHLVRHVAEVIWAQAEAFHRARMLITDQPAVPVISAPAPELADRIDLARAHLAAAVAAYNGDEWTNVPLPFAVIPAAFAANGIVLEYGVHRYDLESSLGADAELGDATRTAVLGLAPALMPSLGKPAGRAPVAYRIEAPSANVPLTWDGSAWNGNDADAVCSIRGDDETVALLVMGRATLDHPGLEVGADPDGAAPRFSALFPGI